MKIFFNSQKILVGIPDFRGFAAQGNLFGGFGGGRDIAVHLQSSDAEGLYSAARAGQQLLMESLIVFAQKLTMFQNSVLLNRLQNI